MGVEDPGLMSIGVFSRRSGLTASALRFYADVGLLVPADVDPVTGYRFYGEGQCERAVLLRRLREIGMPLPNAKAVLSAGSVDAIRMVDEHISAVVCDAETAREQARAITADLSDLPATVVVEVSGPVLAAAIGQVLTATAGEPGLTVLGGVHFEADSGAVVVTATDRYRLSTRTLVADTPAAVAWSATVNGDDLRGCLTDLRRTPWARIEAGDRGMWIRLLGRADRFCRLLHDRFPDYRSMLDALPAAVTRVETSKVALLRSLEELSADLIQLCVGASDITIGNTGSDNVLRLPARVSGPPMDVWFEMTTLYPAVGTAVGADAVCDLRGPAQPATIRSADHGDLTTLAMPTMPPLISRALMPEEKK